MKKHFKAAMDQIEPNGSSLDNIKTKVREAEENPKKYTISKYKRVIKISTLIAATITITFGLGFVSEPIAQAVSSLPLIGETLNDFYVAYEEKHGNTDLLPDQEQIQESGVVVSDQGIDCEMLGAYNYHNGTIGVFFQYSGDVGEIKDYEPNFEFYIGDSPHNEVQLLPGTHYSEEEIDGKYVGTIQLEFEGAETMETLPITFTSLGGVQGEWHFDVPIGEDPAYTDLGGEEYTKGDVTVTFDSLYQEGDTSIIYCDAITYNPNNDEGDVAFTLTLKDDQGEKIDIETIDSWYNGGQSKPNTKESNATRYYTFEITLAEPIPADCEYITADVSVTFVSGETVTLPTITLDI